MIELVYWVASFLSPFLGMGLVAIILLFAFDVNIIVFYIIIGLGIIAGVFLAERIRRKYGSSNYWGRILATPDIWPIDDDKNNKSKKKNGSDVEKPETSE